MKPEDVPEGPLVVDTDVFSLIHTGRGRHEEFGQLIKGHIAVLSFATVGELWAGAEKAGWGNPRRQGLADKLRLYVILPSTDSVTREWGKLYARFKDQIDQNDLWTAACALAQPDAVPIVTNNLRHFQPLTSAFPIKIIHPDL